MLGELHGSDWAAFDAEKAASYFKSFVDTWDRARGTSATADFVESLFEQAPASSPKARALRHLAVLSSGRRLPKPDTTARRQGKRISSEFQNLFEQLRHSRQQRRPREMKSVLEKLRRLQPEHPLIAYSFAEVYASRGPTFDKRRAISYYERFLRLTTDEQLEEGREVKPRFSKNDLVALLQLYATDGSPDQHQGIRDDTRVAITSLEGGKPLYFVSPAVTIGRDERKIDRRIAKADKDIKTIEAKIAKFERELAAWRVWHKAGRKNATASISQLKRDIQRNRRKLSALNEKRPELQARLDWIRSFRKR